MSVSYKLGKLVARNKPASLVVLVGLVAGIVGFIEHTPSNSAPAAMANSAAVPTKAAAVPSAIETACTTGIDKKMTEAKKAMTEKDARRAFQVLYECRSWLQDGPNHAYFVYAMAEAEKASNAAIAKERAAALAERKKQGVSLGMSQDDVMQSSWGRPSHVNRTTTAAGVREQWVYGLHNYLYFEDGVLTSIQN